MVEAGAERVRMVVDRWFPPRAFHIDAQGELRTIHLSQAQQLTATVGVAMALCWMLLGAGWLMTGGLGPSGGEQAVAKTRAYYERLIADRQARLNAAVTQLSSANGSLSGLAHAVEQRHAALALLLTDLHGAPGAARALAPLQPEAVATRSPQAQIQSVEDDQIRIASAAEGYAKNRADRLRLAFHLAGLDPASFQGRAKGQALGGPLVEGRDPQALAVVLDVTPDFAARIQNAARDLNAMRTLGSAAETLPLNKPVTAVRETSGFGVRYDPFTGRPAFHAGQDFAGAYMTPIHVTAPGVVSFTGQRTGYGNVVEVDHGSGFKTRYAHLAEIGVVVGTHVALGDRIGGMGSTGRSTGVHLHYEVWQNGRVQDPTRFLKAGDYVQQTNG